MYKGQIAVGQEELPSHLRAAEALKIRGLVEFQGIASLSGAGDDPNPAQLDVFSEDLLKEERRRERKRRRKMSHAHGHHHQVNGQGNHHRGT